MNDNDRLVLGQMIEYCDKITHRIDQFHITEEMFVENDALADMLLMPVFKLESWQTLYRSST